MSDEHYDHVNDPIDDEFDMVVSAASALVTHAARVGVSELEFPVPEDGNVWVVSAKKLGIKDGDEPNSPPPRPVQHDGETS